MQITTEALSSVLVDNGNIGKYIPPLQECEQLEKNLCVQM